MFPQAAEHVWLFGSHARGDFDAHSDMDILLVGLSDCTAEVQEALQNKSHLLHKKYDICFYTWEGIKKIISSGSLFGWHLRLEGKPLFDKSSELQVQLANIPKYENHLYDLKTLIECTTDCIKSLESGGWSYEFDAGVLATTARNTGIILSNYLGNTDFSQHAPFYQHDLESQLRFPLTVDTYNSLLAFRYASERGENIDDSKTSNKVMLSNAKAILAWQSHCLGYIELRGINHASVH